MSHVDNSKVNVVALNLTNQHVQYEGDINANYIFKWSIPFSETGYW
jgi:hypothetical protein